MQRSSWIRLFLLTLVYYTSLYISINNRSFLILTAVYGFAVWLVVGRASVAFFFAFLATLPFAKGQAYEIVMLPIEDIPRWALYPVKYFFPLYVSDLFWGLTLYAYVRKKFSISRVGSIPVWPAVLLILFILWGMVSALQSSFPEVGLLSSVQLIRLFIVLCLPSILHLDDDERRGVLSIFSATLLFESVWVLLQVLRGGPLGRDIEVYLPGARFGIGSSENRDLLRVSGTFFEPSILGTFLLTQLGVLGATVIRIKRHVLPVPVIVGIGALASIALVFTGSRVIYVLWICLVVYLWHIWKESGRFRWVAPWITKKWFILGALVLTLVLTPYLRVRVTSLTDVLTEYGSASYRLQMMQYALRITTVFPWFGVGLGQSPYYFATMFPDERLVFDPTYPHNLFFQILMETGTIGLVLFMLFIGSVVRYGRKINALRSPYGVAAALYLLCAMSYPIFINHQEIVSYLFVYVGLAFTWEERISV